jgi:FtsP/CotA-like multicopper oxidase with cupredoxin domain
VQSTVINTLNHPFHLHGYQLFVMGMDQHPDKKPMTVELAKMMANFKPFRLSTTTKYPIKDTISIPSKGFTTFRFKADNPGFWLLHCHYGNHLQNRRKFNSINESC